MGLLDSLVQNKMLQDQEQKKASALAEYARRSGNSDLAELALLNPDAATALISKQMEARMQPVEPKSPEGKVQADINAGLLKELPTRGADESALLSFMSGVGNVRGRTGELLGLNGSAPLIEEDTAGLGGTIAQFIPGSQSKKVSKNLDILKSNEALGALKALKEASATGASGLGALNLKELEMLQSSNVALDQGLDAKSLSSEVARARQTYEQAALNMAKKFQETYGYLPESVQKDIQEMQNPQAKTTDPLEGKIAVNPQTGEKLVRTSGKWVPAQ